MLHDLRQLQDKKDQQNKMIRNLIHKQINFSSINLVQKAYARSAARQRINASRSQVENVEEKEKI